MPNKRIRDDEESDNSSEVIDEKDLKLDLSNNILMNKESVEKKEFDTNSDFVDYRKNIEKNNCVVCKRIKQKSIKILNDNEKSSMIQSSWSNLIDNFSIIFVPRLLSKPYEIEGNIKEGLIKKILINNNLIESERIERIENSQINFKHENLDYILPCLHPRVYSKNIENLSSLESKNTKIAILDEMIEILHNKELTLCQKYIEPNKSEIGNLYEFEINSLVWGINGSIYHTGEDNDYANKNNKAYFNLTYSSPELYLPLSNTPLIFVRELSHLKEMIDEILNSLDVHYNRNNDEPFLLAIDVEHHSNQSFKGFVSLLQLSTRTHDYIIDPFNIFQDLHLLNELTTNPRILKIFHGSDYDIIWLQRDFSVYVVNMFDTGQAARILNTPGGYSLKNLLSIYCSIDIDKRFQLADWRERPLNNEFIEYARSDTHYLLYIYDIMKNLLLLQGHKKYGYSTIVSDAFLTIKDNSILLTDEVLERYNFDNFVKNSNDEVKSIEIKNLDPSPLLTTLHNSRLICLKYYTEKPINIWNMCFGIKIKLPKSSLKTPINNTVVTLLSYSLILWRETLSRILDVSINYILKDTMIIKICQKQPINSNELFNLYPQVPTNIRRHSESILNIINIVKTFVLSKSEDEIFDFNSFISHIYSNIANNINIEHDSNKFQINNNKIIISDISEIQLKLQNNSIVNNDNNHNCDSNNSNKSSIFTLKNKVKKVISIKQDSNDDDHFADNLFGCKKETPNSSEIIISKKIKQNIINTLAGDISHIFNSEDLIGGNNSINEDHKNIFTSDSNNICNYKQVNEQEIESKYFNKNQELNNENIEEYQKDKEADQNCLDMKSIKEKYSESSNYIHRKTKLRKSNNLNINNKDETESISDNKPNDNNTGTKINIIPDNIQERIKLLPASIVCDSNIPNFIKKSQDEHVLKKSKKFISMRTKKWHKK